MKISGRKIGPDQPPYVIAELSNNHLGDFERAKRLITAAAEAGADAVKIQTYTADSLTIDCDAKDFVINDPLWRGRTYYELYTSISAPLSWTKDLFDYAKRKGVTLFSSPFDSASVNLLKQLDSPAYKIASFESKDPGFVKQVASTGYPVIVSTGVSNWQEIIETKDWLTNSGCQDFAFLHCISSYPTNVQDMNVAVLDEFKKISPIYGLSDHSLSNVAAICATALGASIIEKHFTLSRADGGPDAAFSLEPNEFRSLCEDVHNAWLAKGSGSALDDIRRQGTQHARSIYVVKDIKKGEHFSSENIRVIRPGFGIEPKHLPSIIGKRSKANLARGTALCWEVVDG